MASNNYVQVRFQSKKYSAAIGMILHNSRAVKPGYLRENEFHNKFHNVSYIFDDTNSEFSEFELENREKELLEW